MTGSPTMIRTLTTTTESSQAEPMKVYHYNHTDSCKFSRWTSKECYQFMSARPWQKVVEFYSEMVKGQLKLEDMFQREIPTIQDEAETKEYSVEPELGSFPVEDRTGRWARVTFKIVLSYHGPSFGGWQKQPGLNTVQEYVTTHTTPAENEHHTNHQTF